MSTFTQNNTHIQPKAEAIRFFDPHHETWRAVVGKRLQRPCFNSRGAALIFAIAVARGMRKGEPV